MKLPRLLVRTALLVSLCLIFILAAAAGEGKLSEYGNPLIQVTVKGVTVTAEVVESPQKLYLGLSYRKTLPQDGGMLFILPSAEIQEFCMRGMRIAIDIIWIGEGFVAGFEKNVAPHDPRVLASPKPVKYVLEVPAGFCDRHKIAAQDQVVFRWPEAP